MLGVFSESGGGQGREPRTLLCGSCVDGPNWVGKGPGSGLLGCQHPATVPREEVELHTGDPLVLGLASEISDLIPEHRL